MAQLSSLLPYFFQYGYLALFALMFLGSLYFPVPSNLSLVGAGILSHITDHGTHFNLIFAALIAFCGSVLGDVVGYSIARRFSDSPRQKRFEAHHAHIRKIEAYLKSHPLLTVGVTRLIGFTSPLVNTLSGFTKMHAAKFVQGDMAGNAVYVILFMGAGYAIGTQSGHFIDRFSSLSRHCSTLYWRHGLFA